jgi:hypothetical protein
MLCAFFWVIPRVLNFICRRFGTLCSIFRGGQVYTYPSMKMEEQRRHIKFRRRGITQKKAYNIRTRRKFEIKNSFDMVCECCVVHSFIYPCGNRITTPQLYRGYPLECTDRAVPIPDVR